MFQTYCFKCRKHSGVFYNVNQNTRVRTLHHKSNSNKEFTYLSIEYIQLYLAGPIILAFHDKWIAKWAITSKKVGGKIISNLHKMSTISSCILSCSDMLKVFLHRVWKKFDNSDIVVEMSLHR